MLVKIHSSLRNVLAICDKELIGKTFTEGQKQIVINPHFFEGEEKSEKEVLEMIEMGAAEDYTFNIVGKESVSLALQCGLIKPEGVITIQDIPLALVLL